MTNRIKGLVVVFNNDIREDDAEELINVIKLLKGVIKVEPSIVNHEDFINRQRIKNEYKEKIWEVFE